MTGMQASAPAPLVRPTSAATPESTSCIAFFMQRLRTPPSSSVTSSKRTPVVASCAEAAAKAAAMPFCTSLPYDAWPPLNEADWPNLTTRPPAAAKADDAGHATTPAAPADADHMKVLRFISISLIRRRGVRGCTA